MMRPVESANATENPDVHPHLREGAHVDSPFDRPTPPAGVPVPPAPRAAAEGDADFRAELLSGADVARLRDRLHDVQAGFVDDPTLAVREARQLVGEVLAALSDAVTERGRAPDGETPGDTEELRVALRRYRSALDRLLSV